MKEFIDKSWIMKTPQSTMQMLIDIGQTSQKILISSKVLWRSKEEKILTIFLTNILLHYYIVNIYFYRLQAKKEI